MFVRFCWGKSLPREGPVRLSWVVMALRQHIQQHLDGLRDRVATVQAVLVSDADGVVLLKSVHTYQDNSLDSALAAVFAASTSQASKLQYGPNLAVVSWHKDRVLVHVNATPFYVSFICSKARRALFFFPLFF